MTDHQEKADRLEDEAADLARESERLETKISETRSDWETKKSDDNVPGAGAEPLDPDAETTSDEDEEGDEQKE